MSGGVSGDRRRRMTWRASFGLNAIGVCAAAILLFGAAGISQGSQDKNPPQNKSAPSQAAKQPTSLRVTTRMVQITVVAQDRDGRPVTGLTKDDFTVSDKRVPQEIALFAPQTNQLKTTSVSNVSASTRTFSNRFAEHDGVPQMLTVILLDGVNTYREDLITARLQLIKFLKEDQPQGSIALYSLTNRDLYLLHDFTTDSSELLRILDRLQKRATHTLEALAPDPWADDMVEGEHELLNPIPLYVYQEYMNRTEITAAALKVIADRLAKLPGRKNLLWVTNSFRFRIRNPLGGRMDLHSFEPEVVASIHELSNANVAIYPIGAFGLPAGGIKPPPPPSAYDTMQVLAQGTGGKALYNRNDLNNFFQQAVEDSRVSYVLGYYPNHNEWDGRFREISVKVKRPGVHLRYRSGYFANPDGQKNDAQGSPQLLADAVASRLESMDLGLDVTAEPVAVSSARQVKAQIHVDGGQLQFNQTGEGWADNIEFVWVELDADSHPLGHNSHTLKLSIPQKEYERISHEGLDFSETIDLSNSAVEVRLVARDTNSGAIGSVNVPLSRLFSPAKAPAALQ